MNFIRSPLSGEDIPLHTLQGKNLLKNYLRAYKFNYEQIQNGGEAEYKMFDTEPEYTQKKNEDQCTNCDKNETPLDNSKNSKKPFQKIRDLTQKIFKYTTEIQQLNTPFDRKPNPDPNRHINDFRNQKQKMLQSQSISAKSVSIS